MKVDIVNGMLFGSESKGEILANLARDRSYTSTIKVGSIQSGHCVFHNGRKYTMQIVPSAWIDPNIKLYLAPGSFYTKEKLIEEINMIENDGYSIKDRIFFDYRSTFVEKRDHNKESDIVNSIGSTGEGAGESLVRKLMRRGDISRAEDETKWFKENGLQVVDMIEELSGPNGLWDDSEEILVEGVQGTLLAVHTSPYYPFCTSRETTAVGNLSDTGLPATSVRDIIGVLRTFPIRVGGNSGPTGGKELSWEDIAASVGEYVTPEKTTVTKRVRRIFEFSDKDFLHSCKVNGPTYLAVTFLDYLGKENYGVDSYSDLNDRAKNFLSHIEEISGVKVLYARTGPEQEHIIRF